MQCGQLQLWPVGRAEDGRSEETMNVRMACVGRLKTGANELAMRPSSSKRATPSETADKESERKRMPNGLGRVVPQKGTREAAVPQDDAVAEESERAELQRWTSTAILEI